MTGTEHREPSPCEWLIARAVHAELAGTTLTDEQRHLVRVVVIAELIKSRDLDVHGCRTSDVREGERT